MKYEVIRGTHNGQRATIITNSDDEGLTLEARLIEALPRLIDAWVAAYKQGAADNDDSYDYADKFDA